MKLKYVGKSTFSSKGISVEPNGIMDCKDAEGKRLLGDFPRWFQTIVDSRPKPKPKAKVIKPTE